MKPVRVIKVFLFSLIISLIVLLAVYEYKYLAGVGETINLDDANVPEVILKADKCSSPYVETELISIFKENDPYFKYIDLKSIDSIRVQNSETILENALKNICSGTILVQSHPDGFKPKDFDVSNLFFKQIYFNFEKAEFTRYTIYEIPIFFSSKIADGKNYVEINNFDIGDFKCAGNCKTESKIEKIVEKSPYNKIKKEIPTAENHKVRNMKKEKEIIKKFDTDEKTKKSKRKFKLFKWLKKGKD